MKTTTLAIAATLLLAGAAHATMMTTPPVRIGNDPAHGHRLICLAVNVGKKDIDMVMHCDLDGPCSTFPFVLPPGQPVWMSPENESGSSKLAYCGFEFSGPKKNVRATVCVQRADGNCSAMLPAY